MLERVGGGAHSFLACRAPVCCTRSDWVACLKMRGKNRKRLAALSERPFGEGRGGEAK